MLHLIGGASKSGKSVLAARLLAERGVPCFPLDGLMVAACSTAAAHFRISHVDPPQQRSAALWPFTAEVINTVSWHLDHYTFEGDYLLPQNAEHFIQTHQYRPLTAAFLGYADMDPETKFDDIRRHAAENDWTQQLTDMALRAHVKQHVAYSAFLRDQCAARGFNYFEAGDSFPDYINGICRALVGESS